MRLLAVVALFAAASSVSCGDSAVSPSSANSGVLNVFLTDTPFTDAKAVLVTFSEVTAHRAADGGFTRIQFGEVPTAMRTCDLKKLQNNAQALLGVATLPAGHYTQLRLVVAGAGIYFDNPASGEPCASTIPAPAGRRVLADVPSGEVRLNREFDIADNGVNTVIVVDFDGNRSITEAGNGRFLLTPVMSVLSVN